MSLYLALVTGLGMLAAASIASRERSALGQSDTGGLGFLGFLTGRRKHYTRNGWIAFTVARLLFVATLVLIVVQPLTWK